MNYDEVNLKNIRKWESALLFITKELTKNNIPYYLSASGLHYILGEYLYPYDIDIFISAKNMKNAYLIFSEYHTSNLHKWKNKYWEFQGIYEAVPFEICEWEVNNPTLRTQRFKNMDITILVDS